MSRIRVALVLAVAFAQIGLAQGNPSTPVSKLLDCVEAKTCKNGVESQISWADMGGIPVLVFKDSDSSYALRSIKGDLNIWVTLANDPRPSRMMTLAGNGLVASAELGRQPGENFPMRMTPEQTAEWRKLRKAYSAGRELARVGPYGEEFKEFWQKQADEALAAVARVMTRLPVLAGSQGRVTLRLDVENSSKMGRILDGVPRPIALNEVLPVRPPSLPGAVEGVLNVRLIIAKDGTVKEANVVTHELVFLHDATIAAARQWRFEPVLMNGAPVEVVFRRSVTFSRNRGPITLSDSASPPALEVEAPKLVKEINPIVDAATASAIKLLLVEVVIDKTGKVKGATVLRGFSATVDQAVLDTVRQWTYQQTTVNGLPMEVGTVVAFTGS